jgi:hypothetical protein
MLKWQLQEARRQRRRRRNLARDKGSAHDTQISTVLYALGNLGDPATADELAKFFLHGSDAVKAATLHALSKLESHPTVEQHLVQIFRQTPPADLSTRLAVVDALSVHNCSTETVLMVLDEGYDRASISPNGSAFCQHECKQGCRARSLERCNAECQHKCDREGRYCAALGLALSRFEIMGHNLNMLSSRLPQRRLLSFVDSISKVVSDIRDIFTSVTLIKILLSHIPFLWEKHFGTNDLGSTARLHAINSAFFKIGLFDGGMGVSLDNFAAISVKAWVVERNIFRAGLSFEAGALYKTPISADLIPAVTQNFPHSLQRLVTIFMNGPSLIWELLLMIRGWKDKIQGVVHDVVATDESLRWIIAQLLKFKTASADAKAFVPEVKALLNPILLDHFWESLDQLQALSHMIERTKLQERVSNVQTMVDAGFKYVQHFSDMLNNMQGRVQVSQKELSVLFKSAVSADGAQPILQLSSRLATFVRGGFAEDSFPLLSKIGDISNVYKVLSTALSWPGKASCASGYDLALGKPYSCALVSKDDFTSLSPADGSCQSGYSKNFLKLALLDVSFHIQDWLPICADNQYAICCMALKEVCSNCSSSANDARSSLESCLKQRNLDTGPVSVFMSTPASLYAKIQRSYCICKRSKAVSQMLLPSLATGKCLGSSIKAQSASPQAQTTADVASWCSKHELFQSLLKTGGGIYCCHVLNAAYNNCSMTKEGAEKAFEACLLQRKLPLESSQMLKSLPPSVAFSAAQRQACVCLTARSVPASSSSSAGNSQPSGMPWPRCSSQHYPELGAQPSRLMVLLRSKTVNGSIISHVYVNHQDVGDVYENTRTLQAGTYMVQMFHEGGRAQPVLKVAKHDGTSIRIVPFLGRTHNSELDMVVVSSVLPDSRIASGATYMRIISLLNMSKNTDEFPLHVLDCTNHSNTEIEMAKMLDYTQNAHAIMDVDGMEFLSWWNNVSRLEKLAGTSLFTLPVAFLNKKLEKFVSHANMVKKKQLDLHDNAGWLVDQARASTASVKAALQLLIVDSSSSHQRLPLEVAVEKLGQYIEDFDVIKTAAASIQQESGIGKAILSTLQALQQFSFQNVSDYGAQEWLDDLKNMKIHETDEVSHKLAEIEMQVNHLDIFLNNSLISSTAQARLSLEIALERAVESVMQELTGPASDNLNTSVNTSMADLLGGLEDLCHVLRSPNLLSLRKVSGLLLTLATGEVKLSAFDLEEAFNQQNADQGNSSFWDQIKAGVQNMHASVQEQKGKIDQVINMVSTVSTYLPGNAGSEILNFTKQLQRLSKQVDEYELLVKNVASFDLRSLYSDSAWNFMITLQNLTSKVENDLKAIAETIENGILGTCGNFAGAKLRGLPISAPKIAKQFLVQMDEHASSVHNEASRYIRVARSMHANLTSSLLLLLHRDGFLSAANIRSALAKKLHGWQTWFNLSNLESLSQYDWKRLSSLPDEVHLLAGDVHTLYSTLVSSLSVAVIPGATTSPQGALEKELTGVVNKLTRIEGMMTLGSAMLVDLAHSLPLAVSAQLEAETTISWLYASKNHHQVWSQSQKMDSFHAAVTQACMMPSSAFQTFHQASSVFFQRICDVQLGNTIALAAEAFSMLESLSSSFAFLFNYSNPVVSALRKELADMAMNALQIHSVNNLADVLFQLPQQHLKHLAEIVCLEEGGSLPECNVMMTSPKFLIRAYDKYMSQFRFSAEEREFLKALDLLAVNPSCLGSGAEYLRQFGVMCDIISAHHANQRMKLAKLLLSPACSLDLYADDEDLKQCPPEQTLDVFLQDSCKAVPPEQIYAGQEGDLILVERVTELHSYFHSESAMDLQISANWNAEAYAKLCQAVLSLNVPQYQSNMSADFFHEFSSGELIVVLQGPQEGAGCHNLGEFYEWMAQHVVNGIAKGFGRAQLADDVPWLLGGWLTTAAEYSCPTATDYHNFAQRVALHIQENYPGYPVTFTGHSLGGALAILSGLVCIVDAMGPDLYSAIVFASPGMAAFAKQMGFSDAHLSELQVQNFVAQGDLVPFSDWHFGYLCMLPAGGESDCLAGGERLIKCMPRAKSAHELTGIVEATHMLPNATCIVSRNSKGYSLFHDFLKAILKGSSLFHEVSSKQAIRLIFEILEETGAVLSPNFAELLNMLVGSNTTMSSANDLLSGAERSTEHAFPLNASTLLSTPLHALGLTLTGAKDSFKEIADAANQAQDLLSKSLQVSAYTLPEDVKLARTILHDLTNLCGTLQGLIPAMSPIPHVVIDSAQLATRNLEPISLLARDVAGHVDQVAKWLERAVEAVGATVGGKQRPTEQGPCGEGICLGIHERSLDAYRKWVFPLQYTRFWDLSSPPLLDVEKRKQRFTLPGACINVQKYLHACTLPLNISCLSTPCFVQASLLDVPTLMTACCHHATSSGHLGWHSLLEV